jgi:transcriptional regulator with XRE-family HTH domain
MPTPTAVKPNFGTWLLAYRTKKALSQADMAQQIGVGVRTIRAWEAGDIRPSCRSLRLIAEGTDTRIDELLVEPDVRGPDLLHID